MEVNVVGYFSVFDDCVVVELMVEVCVSVLYRVEMDLDSVFGRVFVFVIGLMMDGFV